MRALITGGKGFVGQWLASHLKDHGVANVVDVSELLGDPAPHLRQRLLELVFVAAVGLGDERDPRDAVEGGRCDAWSCVVRVPEGLLALPQRPEALADDCARAAILVSVAAVTCKAPHFITDAPRASRDQGYALWFTPSFKVESVRGWRGERPWVK